MIAKNEEDCIANAINSVKDLVDEIIVVDTGSTDKTKEIAESFGAKTYNFNWNDDFSSARNFSLSKCTSEWILILDCDETIAKKDCEKIKELVNNEKAIAYRVIQRTYSTIQKEPKWNYNDNSYEEEEKGYSGWQYRGIVRLFKRLPELNFIYPIHESIKPSIQKVGKITSSNIVIHHFTKNTKEKNDLYLKLLNDKIVKHPSYNAFIEISIQLKEMGFLEKSESYYNKAMKLKDNNFVTHNKNIKNFKIIK
jgi:glycosyltransferase involved in cell wall biosynthesis